MELGKIGIWTANLDYNPAARARQAAAEIEQLGYAALWFPEAFRREAFANASMFLHATQRMVVAIGIANIYARDPVTMNAGQLALAEAFPDRFLLGLGVSHSINVQRRGHEYGKPVATMRAYLDAMDAAPFQGVRPSVTPRRVLAALGPAMLKLAAEKTWGAHPYFAPVAHTKFARQTLGRGPLLAVEQAAVLETNPVTARAIARLHTTYYLALPNYANNLRRLGYRDDDIKEGGSDRLVDDLVAWGDVPAITKRVQQHLDSGADHVCIQVLTQERDEIPMAAWRSLASVLLS